MRRHSLRKIVAVFVMLVFTGCGSGPSVTKEEKKIAVLEAPKLVSARKGMVSTQEAVASKVGLEILKDGGNAVDAAVAVGFALAVTLPQAGNLGGGGFMLVHDAKSGDTVAIDYRETAPAAATRDMFLDNFKLVVENRSRYTHLSAGVPGTVAGLALALEKYGTLSLKEALEPAIELAEEGIVVTPHLKATLEAHESRFMDWPQSAEIFFKPDGSAYEVGEVLIQADLAASLKAIAEEGPRAFYEGAIARKIAAQMQANGGAIDLEDLKNYRARIREPVRGTYRGHEIVSMPPPSSGGIHIIQILNILESVPVSLHKHNSAETLHWMAEAMKLAYADRSRYLGDPDFWDVPVKGLTSKEYAAELRGRIDPTRAKPSEVIFPGAPAPYESRETTHFSIMDKMGNAVSNTYTLNFPYGSGIVVKGTGILLNNEMDDFSAKPGVPNAYGLIGGKANAIEPGKRPLSSMSPTIVFKKGKPVLVTGSPGGSRIITTTLQVILNVIDHGMDIAAATGALRVHHQWLPDELRVEPGLSDAVLQALRERGHNVVVREPMGATQSIVKKKKDYQGASDPRRPGALTLGYGWF